MKFRKNRVVVLGAGPAGLIAAQAAERLGYQVEVYTAPGPDNEPRKSELHGCQYLHSPIPGISVDANGPAREVSYRLTGTTEGYRRKVYGDSWHGTVSPDEYGPEANHFAWNLRDAYATLWRHWDSRIYSVDVTPNMAARMTSVKGQTLLCTIPATALCLRQADHKFTTQSVWAMGTRESTIRAGAETGIGSLPYYAPPMTVECNGDPDTRWYRAATVFGHSTIEWPAGVKPPIAGVVAVNKPLSTDCDCHVGKDWHRLGRYGKWQKGVLVHQVYDEVKELLA